jgi:copper transport protein
MVGLAVLIGFGAFARWSLRNAAAPDDPDRPDFSPQSLRQRVVQAHLRQSVFLELEIGTVILVLTSVLVNTVPAKEAVVYTEHRSLHAPGLAIEATMTPSRTGTDTIGLTIFTADGYPRLAKSVTGSLSLPSKRISSLPLTFAQVPGQNRMIATASFPYAGTWSLTFDVATSSVDVTQFTTAFTVHAED